jgi:hypothetical protein
LLYSLRQHNSLTGHSVIRNYYLSHGDANTNRRADFVGSSIVANDIGGLESQRGTDGIRRSSKFSNQCVASNLVSDPIMAGNGFGESSKRILNAVVSKCLIQLDERSGADNIGVQEDSKLTFSHDKGLLVGI